MFRKFRALNGPQSESDDESDGEDTDGGKGPIKVTREAEEASVRERYHEAILKLADGEKLVAKTVLEELLESRLLKEITQSPEESKNAALTPLYYATCKNLGDIYSADGKHAEALAVFLKATDVDDTEALLWYKVGVKAFKVDDYDLAMYGMKNCIEISPDFWPGLDNLVSLCYIMTAYTACLEHIHRCLETHPDYVRGLAIKDEIFRGNPYLKEFYKDQFGMYENRTYDQEKAKEIMDKLNGIVEKRTAKNYEPIIMETIAPDFDLENSSLVSIGRAIRKFFVESEADVKMLNPIDLSRWIENVKAERVEEEPKDQPMEVIEAAPSDIVAPPPPPPVEEPQMETIMDSANGEQLMDTTVESSMGESSDVDAVQTADFDQPMTPTNGNPPPFDHSSSSPSIVSLNSPPVSAAGGFQRDVGGGGSWRKKRGGPPSSGQSVFKRRSTRLIPGFHMDDPEAFGPLTTKPVGLSEHLRSYMPTIFDRGDDDDDEEDEDGRGADESMDESNNTTESRPNAPYFDDDRSSKAEKIAFLERQTNSCVRLAWNYLDWLRVRAACDHRWSEELRRTYVECFECLKNHTQLIQPWHTNNDDDAQLQRAHNRQCLEEGRIRLIYAELKAVAKTATDEDDGEAERDRLSESVFYLGLLADSQQAFEGEDDGEDARLVFLCRVDWIEFHLREESNKYNAAYSCLELCRGDLERRKTTSSIPLEHCDSIISTASIKSRMDRLDRAGLLERIEEIFARGDHSAVVDILRQHLSQEKNSNSDEDGANAMEKLRQYEILMECFCALDERAEVAAWLAKALRSALTIYGRIDVEEKTGWWKKLSKLLSIGEWAISAAKSDCTNRLSNRQRRALADALIDSIALTMDCPLKADDVPESCWLAPWTMLYQVAWRVESRELDDDEYLKTWYEKSSSSNVLMATRSLMILWKCHEELGRRRLCMLRGGWLLTGLAQEIMQILRHPSVAANIQSSCVDDTLNCAEQCFYCLYKYPPKKKRHLDEHEAKPIELDWDRAYLLFDFVKPDEAPEFDDHPHATAVSADSVQLLHRMESMVPVNLKPDSLAERLDDFFDDLARTDNDFPQRYLENEPIVGDLYHLLADYYLKTQEFEKAVKYYQYDLCICADRFDSWAGLAMSRSTILEARLRSMELKHDQDAVEVVTREARAALYCYERAVAIRKNHYVLLVEFGSITYAMHSFYSRALKHTSTKVDAKSERKLKKLRNLYLRKSETAFVEAGVAAEDPSTPNKEEWMHNYMLGKIAEKRRPFDPRTAWTRYHAATYHLDKDGARYPERIKYNTPQRYALETLEVYYRMHASIVKWLLRRGDRGDRGSGEDEDEDEKIIEKAYRFVEMFRASPIHDGKGNLRSPSAARLLNEPDLTELIDGMLDEVEKKDRDQSMGESDKPPASSSTMEIDYESPKSVEVVEVIKPPSTISKSTSKWTSTRSQLIKWCVEAFQLCIRRFSNHYKSYYWLARIYFEAGGFKDSQKSRQILLGPISIRNFQISTGFFQHRKPSNYFEGIWRIPADDIDRAGSFSEHIFRSVVLLCRILVESNDCQSLADLVTALHRKPSVDKHKFLREPDREELMEIASSSTERAVWNVYERDPETAVLTAYRLQIAIYRLQSGNRSRWCDLIKFLLSKWKNIDFMQMDTQAALNMCTMLEQKRSIPQFNKTPTTVAGSASARVSSDSDGPQQRFPMPGAAATTTVTPSMVNPTTMRTTVSSSALSKVGSTTQRLPVTMARPSILGKTASPSSAGLGSAPRRVAPAPPNARPMILEKRPITSTTTGMPTLELMAKKPAIGTPTSSRTISSGQVVGGGSRTSAINMVPTPTTARNSIASMNARPSTTTSATSQDGIRQRPIARPPTNAASSGGSSQARQSTGGGQSTTATIPRRSLPSTSQTHRQSTPISNRGPSTSTMSSASSTITSTPLSSGDSNSPFLSPELISTFAALLPPSCQNLSPELLQSVYYQWYCAQLTSASIQSPMPAQMPLDLQQRPRVPTATFTTRPLPPQPLPPPPPQAVVRRRSFLEERMEEEGGGLDGGFRTPTGVGGGRMGQSRHSYHRHSPYSGKPRNP